MTSQQQRLLDAVELLPPEAFRYIAEGIARQVRRLRAEGLGGYGPAAQAALRELSIATDDYLTPPTGRTGR
jgi:hypothetical protein